MAQQTPQLSAPFSLVLLPGLDGTGNLFKWFVDELPAMLNPIVISFPRSEDDNYAALETRVMCALPRDRPIAILGESFSGPLALRIAARRDENLVAVILVASFISKPVKWLPRFFEHLMCRFIFDLPAQRPLLRWFLFGKNVPIALINETMNSLSSVAPPILAGRAKAALTVDATAEFLRCPVPIFYLGGRQDRLISSKTVERLKALRPDLECVMLEAPHFLLQRAPAAAARAVIEFLSRHYPLG